MFNANTCGQVNPSVCKLTVLRVILSHQTILFFSGTPLPAKELTQTIAGVQFLTWVANILQPTVVRLLCVAEIILFVLGLDCDCCSNLPDRGIWDYRDRDKKALFICNPFRGVYTWWLSWRNRKLLLDETSGNKKKNQLLFSYIANSLIHICCLITTVTFIVRNIFREKNLLYTLMTSTEWLVYQNVVTTYIIPISGNDSIQFPRFPALICNPGRREWGCIEWAPASVYQWRVTCAGSTNARNLPVVVMMVDSCVYSVDSGKGLIDDGNVVRC